MLTADSQSPATSAEPVKVAPHSKVTAKPTLSRAALFDLKGTLISHRKEDGMKGLPMMSFMLRRLREAGFATAILTRYSQEAARRLVVDAGLPTDVPIFSGSSRGRLVKEALENLGNPERAWYFDDKPDGLADVRKIGARCLEGRVFGFIGSRCYGTKLALECRESRTPLALGPCDIVEILEEGKIFHDFCLSHRKQSLTPEELAFLLPGLSIPCSAYNDGHCRAVNFVFDTPAGQWAPIWRNLGWIGAGDNIGYYMFLSASIELGLSSFPQNAGSIIEIKKWFESLASSERRDMCDLFKRILLLMDEGISEIGRAAEDCRPPGSGQVFLCDKGRMDQVRELLSSLCR